MLNLFKYFVKCYEIHKASFRVKMLCRQAFRSNPIDEKNFFMTENLAKISNKYENN